MHEPSRKEHPRPPAAVVVLCDVRGSRRLPDRPSFFRRLERALGELNRQEGALLGAFEAQAGLDEFAGVVRPGALGGLLPGLWEALHPVQVRCAVAAGSLDVVPTPAGGLPGAAGFDGPAFHRAAALLDDLRGGDRLFALDTGQPPVDELLSALGDLLYGRILAWTERQLEVVQSLRRHGSQQAASKALGVHQSTVSRVLAAAEHERVAAARSVFERALDRATAMKG